MPVTGCNYGAHQFKPFMEAWPDPDMHLHKCVLCGATYVNRGSERCIACYPNDPDAIELQIRRVKAMMRGGVYGNLEDEFDTLVEMVQKERGRDA